MKNKKTVMLVLSILMLFILGNFAYAAEAIDKNFPLVKGTTWNYEGSVKFGEAEQEKEKKMSWNMSVLDSVEKNGTVVAVVNGYPGNMTFYEEGKETVACLLINSGNKIYFHTPEDAQKAFAEISGGTKKIEDLVKEASLIISLPLKKDDVYGMEEGTDLKTAKEERKFCWSVNEIKKINEKVKGFEAKDCMQYSLTYTSTSDLTSMEFVAGLGISNFEYSHRGTEGAVIAKLVGFSSKPTAETSKVDATKAVPEKASATKEAEIKK